MLHCIRIQTQECSGHSIWHSALSCSASFLALLLPASLPCSRPFHRPPVAVQMTDIIVNVLPALEGRGPTLFDVKSWPEAHLIILWLVEEYGQGQLEDSQKRAISPKQEDGLKAGHYTFTLTGSQGEAHDGMTLHLLTITMDQLCKADAVWAMACGALPEQQS